MRRRKYRSRNLTAEETVENYQRIRLRVLSGERLMTVLEKIDLPYSTYKRTIRSVGEASILFPGCLDLHRGSWKEAEEHCENLIKSLSKEDRAAAKKAQLII